MSDSILKKYGGRNGADASLVGSSSDADEIEDFITFGWLRGMRDRAITLELRQKTGHILAVSYAFIAKLEYEPSTGIILHVSGGQQISIKGRNLNAEIRPNVRLFEGLARFRVPWLQEAGRATEMVTADKSVLVDAISW